MFKHFKKIYKNKKGDLNIFSLIAIPALFAGFYAGVGLYSSYSSVKSRAQTALDASLLYLSTQGKASTLIGNDGNPIELCSFQDDEEFRLKFENYIVKGLFSKINGYSSQWTIGYEIKTVPNDNVDYISITVKAVVPVGNIVDYNSYYNSHPNWKSSLTRSFTLTGTSQCRSLE